MKPIERSILPFLSPTDGAFDDNATRLMGEAFDTACTELSGTDRPRAIYETVASRIITAASKGERDPQRLKLAGLAGLDK